MGAGKILVVDDDPQIRRVVRAALSGHHYEVFEARSGEDCLDRFRDVMPDLVLLDINMPGIGGIEACRSLRSGSKVPIIMLTVRDSEKDKVAALDAGADDYVTKPFGIEEMLARIRAALRRSPSSPESGPHVFSSADLEIDFDIRRVRIPGKDDVRLTLKEFELLRYLVVHAGRPISHRELLQEVWESAHDQETKHVHVAIHQLRKKIEPIPSKPRYILTEPCVGYRFSSSGSLK